MGLGGSDIAGASTWDDSWRVAFSDGTVLAIGGYLNNDNDRSGHQDSKYSSGSCHK